MSAPAPPARHPELLTGPVGSALAAATAWLSLLTWRGMADDPMRVTGPLALVAVAVAVMGWALRRTTQRAWLTVTVQSVVLLLWLLHHVTGRWLPTFSAIGALAREMADGAVAAHRYYSPVSIDHPEFHQMLLAGGLALIILVDLLVCGLRQPALAGLVLLLVVTISASILIDGIRLPVFVLTALGWLALLALRERDRLHAWGGADPQPVPRLEAATAKSPGVLAMGPAFGIAAVTVLVAVIATGGVSSAGRIFDGPVGQGGGNGLDVANPMLDMRRNLREPSDAPLVRVDTNDPNSPTYLRLTVLDVFDGVSWRTGPRNTDNTREVDGRYPYPTGVAAGTLTDSRVWRITTDREFRSRWLPLPTPTLATSGVGANWRYDADTLDVVGTPDTTAAGIAFEAQTATLPIDPAALRATGRAPGDIVQRMTALPERLPAVFADTARRVTRDKANSWDRAVALQDWFRSRGGFRYSTEPAAGSGINTLSRFITTDRVGYCEQFATAMAVMARTLGIPARVSVGFLRPDQVRDNAYQFSAQDLHAWPELYFNGVGWVRLEPTPSTRTGEAPAYTQRQLSDILPSPSASASASTKPVAPAPKPRETPSNTGTTTGSGSISWLPVAVLVAAVLLLLVLLPRLLRRATRHRRWSVARDPRAAADAAWAEVRSTSVDLDLGWSETATVRANGRHLQTMVADRGAQQALDEVVTFVELTRYAGVDEASARRIEELRREVGTWQSAAYDAVGPRRARRARWLPSSVLRRRESGGREDQ